MANITILNTSSDLSSKTVLSAENPYTVTGLHTFDRDPSSPFAVTSGSASVANLDADKVDGIEGTDMARLSVANTFSFFGTNIFSSSGVGGNILALRNTLAGTGNFTSFQVGNDLSQATAALAVLSSTFSPSGANLADGAVLQTNGAGGLSITCLAAASMRFYTNSVLRWGINSAGDFTFGTSQHVVDSNGAPSISSGFGITPSISGTDYAHTIVLGSTPGTTGDITFGHSTFTTAPVVLATFGNNASGPPAATFVNISAVSTSGYSLRYAGTPATGDKIFVHVRGF